MKWNLISSIANLVHELPHEFPNDSQLHPSSQTIALKRKHDKTDSQWYIYQAWNIRYLTSYTYTLSAVMIPMNQRCRWGSIYFCIYHCTQTPAVTRDRFKVVSQHDKSMLPASKSIFSRIFKNTTNTEMTCTLLIVLFFTRIALWYQYPWEKTS